MTREQAEGYLAAIIDGEGCVYLNEEVGAARGRHRRVTVVNTERAIIDATLDACRVLGIHAKVYRKSRCAGRVTAWEVTIHNRAGFEALSEIPIRSRRKRAKLAALLATYDQPRRRWAA